VRLVLCLFRLQPWKPAAADVAETNRELVTDESASLVIAVGRIPKPAAVRERFRGACMLAVLAGDAQSGHTKIDP
jgi:hypothetical protein